MRGGREAISQWRVEGIIAHLDGGGGGHDVCEKKKVELRQWSERLRVLIS